ncbi:MAG: bifunctional adenosylcobinamide kinase/adenosylcobinamide-phosphate guanylyltransferase, partial [bacterium]|nr:bifunctional adenosylcobinamide kinase/adenosylcobinamide-phosphate guanylyltransferase [bacterium]
MAGNDKLILIGGGVRSGKSRLALALARELGERRVFLATAEAGDAEMRERIAAHRAERGDDFETIEEPAALAAALGRIGRANVVVIDCVTFWLSNLLLRGDAPGEILQKADALLASLQSLSCHVILVTNEVGMGVVPESALGRQFRDLTGTVNARIARRADEVYFSALGMMLRLKPGP